MVRAGHKFTEGDIVVSKMFWAQDEPDDGYQPFTEMEVEASKQRKARIDIALVERRAKTDYRCLKCNRVLNTFEIAKLHAGAYMKCACEAIMLECQNVTCFHDWDQKNKVEIGEVYLPVFIR